MGLFKQITKIFRSKEARLVLEECEDLLLESGLMPKLCLKIIDALDKNIGAQTSAEKIGAVLADMLRPLMLDVSEQWHTRLYACHELPVVCLFVGVNGAGKTTSIAKFARYLMHKKNTAPQSLILVAGDTFRAAAVLQLEQHAKKLGISCIKQHDGADSAAVIFDAVSHAKSLLAASSECRHPRYVLADTAGRMNTRKDLITQLQKIYRITQKAVPAENIITFMVIDGSSGLNTINQTKDFAEAIPLDSVILSKYDGSTRGGVIISIAQECAVPCSFLGTGEQHDDLRPFKKEEFLHEFLAQ